MICKACRKRKHHKCLAKNLKRDYSSCDCQHRPIKAVPAPADSARPAER